jgi:hypothetical protein
MAEKLSSVWKSENRFVFEDGESNPPTHFWWKDVKLKLTNELVPVLEKLQYRRKRQALMK